MAMANIAELFFRAGLKVLIVDWDLEAPGLEKFFFSQKSMRDEGRDIPNLSLNEVMNKQGVVDMLLDYKEKMTHEIETESEEDLPFLKPEDLAIDVYPDWPGKGKLKLLTAGRRSQGHFSEYVNAVLNFDWQDFYNNWHGELYFEWMRNQFEKIADVVLIDSRTGVTEMGGVCTYQFADIIVVFCAPNKQNLDGSLKMATKFKLPKLVEVRGDRRLDVLIVPSRVEDRAETELLNDFRKEFIGKFRGFIPEAIDEGEETLWKLRIPQVPYYAFGELVAVRESGKARSDDLVTAFRTLAKAMDTLGSMGIGEILGRASAKSADTNPQNLRDFTVQIRDPNTHAPVGTGIIISIDGKILTSYRVVQKAIGSDPFYASDKVVEIFIPRLRVEEQQQTASVYACMSKYDDDIILLQLKNSSISLSQEQAAILGIADRSSNHTFRSYGLSRSANYTDNYSKGTILGDISHSTIQSLRLDPFQLESSQGSIDMPGAPVLDVDLNLVVGIISEISAEEAGKAIAVNAHILAFEPFKIPIQTNMGDVYFKQGKYKEAVMAYKDALDVDSGYSPSWIGLGRAYAQMGKYGDATAAFENAANVDSSSGPAWYELGRMYKRLSRFDEAISAYEKAIENDPSMAVAWLEKGGIYLEQQNIDKAILAYKRAIELDENMSLAWQDLGNAYIKKEMYDAAIKAYENAVRIDPDRMLEIAAKRDLCIKASQESHERAKHLQEMDKLLRETERLQYQNEMLQKEKDEQRNEKNDLHKEKEDLLKKTEKLQYELKMLVTKKKWQIASIVIIFGVFMAGFSYYSIRDSQVKFEEYENNLIPFQETVNEYRTYAYEYNDIFARYLASQSELLKRKSDIKDEDRSLSILLALESLGQCWTPEGYRALQNSIKPLGDLSQYGVPEPIYNEDGIDQMVSSQDGTLLAIGSGASIQLWNLNTWKPVGNRMRIGDYGGLKKIIFSYDGRLLAAIGNYGDVKIWTTNSQVELVNETFNQVSDISFNNNGTQVAIADENRVLLLMLAENSTSLNRLTSARNESDIKGLNYKWIKKSYRDSYVDRVSFNENGSALAIISDDGAILNLANGTEANFNNNVKNYIINSWSFNQNKTRLAISINDMVDIWDMTNCKWIRRINISGVRDIALSPDGNSLAAAISNDIIRVFGIGSKNLTFQWDYKLEGATDYLKMLEFSPDGKRLFVSDYSDYYYPLRSLIILDALSGQTMDTLFAFGNRLIILPDGNRIGFTLNGMMYIYLIDTNDLMDKACSILEKNGISGLSQDEWSKYMGDESYRQTCPCSDELYLMSPTSYSTKSDYSILHKRLKRQQLYSDNWYLY